MVVIAICSRCSIHYVYSNTHSSLQLANLAALIRSAGGEPINLHAQLGDGGRVTGTLILKGCDLKWGHTKF